MEAHLLHKSLSKGRRSTQRGQESHQLPFKSQAEDGDHGLALGLTSVQKTRLPHCLKHGVTNPGFSLEYAGSELNQEICSHKLTLLFLKRRKLFMCSSVTQSCPTLCDPIDDSTPGFPVYHQLPELTQTHVHHVSDAIKPSHPLSSASPPTFNLS